MPESADQAAEPLDDRTLRDMLGFAHPMVLRAVLYQLTGDDEISGTNMPLVEEPTLFGPLATIADPSALEALRENAFTVLRQIESGERGFDEPTRERMLGAMQLCTGDDVPDHHFDLNMEEAGFKSRGVEWTAGPPHEALSDYHVVVIGAGLGGIAATLRLDEMGIRHTVFEKNAGVGGTWYANRYPGARVDVPSLAYCYAWELDYPWPEVFSAQPELRRYFEYITEKYDLLKNIRLETEVVSAHWDDAESIWNVTARQADGSLVEVRANAVISAVGLLDRPRIPDIPGMDAFEGEIIHTAKWNDDLDLSGKRVAIVGTGATGLQIAPAIASKVAELTIFQRTPPWVIHLDNYEDPIPPQVNWLRANYPYYANWMRFRTTYAVMDKFHDIYEVDPLWDRSLGSRNYLNELMRQSCLERLREELDGRPDLIEQCTPHYPPMVIRFVMDNGWFPTLLRDNVNLRTDGIAEITETGIRTSSDESVPLDVIIFATGFHANRFLWPMEIKGSGGQTLEEFWSRDGGRAYLGINMPGFPNFYCLYGPNTNPTAGTPFTHDELEVRYALGCIKEMIECGHRSMDLREEVFDDYQARLDERLRGTIWMDPSVEGYYRNEHGRVAVMMPWLLEQQWSWTLKPNLDEYKIQ